MANAQVTQVTPEVIWTSESLNAQVTQVTPEVIWTPESLNAQVTQVTPEAVWTPESLNAQVTQVIPEAVWATGVLPLPSGPLEGINTYVAFGWGGSTFNISGDGNRARLARNMEPIKVPMYLPPGRTVQRSSSGVLGWSFFMDGFWNDSDGRIEALAASVMGEEVELIFGPNGSEAGRHKVSGSGTVRTFNTESPVDGMITAAVEVVSSTGSMSRGMFQ